MSSATLALPRTAGRPHAPVLVPEEAADHLTRLYRLAWSLCGSPQLAEDLVQETYAKVLSRPRVMRRGESFPYLARTLRNTLYEHRRREQRGSFTSLPVEELDLADRRAEADPEAAARAQELYGIVAGLPTGQREVLAAVDVAGMSYREAARMLRVPVGTVMSRLSRARGQMAADLGEEWALAA